MKKKQKTLNKMKRILCSAFALVMLFAFGFCAYAEDEAVNRPIEISVSTDKSQYKVTGIATITATVTNKSDKDMNHVSAKAIFTDLAPVKGGSTNVQADTLKAGESLSFTYKATLNKNEHKLNIFQKIMLFFVRLFNGGYTANNNGFDDGRICAEQVDTLAFGSFSADNTIRVWYEETIKEEAEFAGGDGTQENPYQVATPEQLNAVRNHLDSCFVQTADIDMSEWGNWEPIGKAVPKYGSAAINTPVFEMQLFSGIYNGNTYKISNLTIQDDKVSAQYDCYGLFAGAKDAVIKNVNLENISVDIDKAETDYRQIFKDEKISYSVCAGGVLGIVYQDCTLKNCIVSGKINVIHCNNAYVGGVVGHGSAERCRNFADIVVYADQSVRYEETDSTVHCGGIVGMPNGFKDSISYCSNYGNINATAGNFLYAGGITGSYGRITECMNVGLISGKRLFGKSTSSTGTDCAVGGISGYLSGTVASACVNYGEIYAYSYKYITNAGNSVGGICGANVNAGARLVNCYNKAKSIKSVYAEDQMSTRAWAGRIAGFGSNQENCFSANDTIVIGDTKGQSINGEDLSPDEFLNEETYKDFDFENTWKIDPDIGGAVLR